MKKYRNKSYKIIKSNINQESLQRIINLEKKSMIISFKDKNIIDPDEEYEKINKQYKKQEIERIKLNFLHILLNEEYEEKKKETNENFSSKENIKIELYNDKLYTRLYNQVLLRFK